MLRDVSTAAVPTPATVTSRPPSHPGHGRTEATTPSWPRPCHSHGHHSIILLATAASWPRPPSLFLARPHHGCNCGHLSNLCWPRLRNSLGHGYGPALATAPSWLWLWPPSHPGHNHSHYRILAMATFAPQPRPPTHPSHGHVMAPTTPQPHPHPRFQRTRSHQRCACPR